MYLIRLKISGKELPSVLPASLIPPSLRQSVPAPPAQPPVLQQPQPSSAAQDLFGLDDAFGPTQEPGTPAPAFIQSPQRVLSPRIQTSSPAPASPIISAPLQPRFQPQSSFGRGIASPVDNTFIAPVQVAMQSGSVFGDQDLLGDADPEISQKLTAETSELANLSNQIGSLNNATRDTQAQKARADTELATVSQQKRDIEARLKQIRSLYDAEVANVKAVETQLATVRGELAKNRQEVTILEASLHALQQQHHDQRTALQKDQTENTGLKTRIASINEEVKQLKDALEKVKRDARQQRGMVAINKKQLSTLEGERDKVQGEIDAEKKVIEESVQRDIKSPLGSERSGTNPFLQRQVTGEGVVSPQTFSPFPSLPEAQRSFSPEFHQSAFDNAFDDFPPFPPTQKPQPTTPQQFRESSESTIEAPPSIASALSPPLAARGSPYAESASSSLAVNPPRSGVVSGAVSPSVSDELSRKETDEPVEHPSEGPVVSNVQETEAKASDDETTPMETPEVHGPRSAEAITSAEIVQETLSNPPKDEDLAIASPNIEHHEIAENEVKGVALPGGFPSNESDEGRESWVDLGDESKSFPSETQETILPPNRSDPFAFSTSSAPPKVATKEDFDAAFSGFANLGNKEENGVFKKDFNSEFPPIEEFGDDDSESEDERPGDFAFNDEFSKEIPNKAVETPLQQTLPISSSETAAKVPPPSTTPDASAPLTDVPPPVPPKDTLAPDESSAPPITPGQTPPPETGADPPAYSEYRNTIEESAGSNDLSGLLPQRGEPKMSAAPYTSPPLDAVLATPAPFALPEPVMLPEQPPVPFFSVQPPTEPPQTVPEIARIEEPKSMTPSQTFGAFDFSGLTDAAPLDESQDDPFKFSTRSDTFGEFDTSFDSAPVTPAKQGTLPPAKDDFSNFDFGTPADFDTFPTPQPQQTATSASNFDDVFATFDRPTQLSPPALPAREPSPQDDPNLKTLTGILLVDCSDLEMGFKRTDAIKALEKHNYNLSEVYLF